MLLRFSIENFMSFKELVKIDFEATSIREMPENTSTISTASFDHKILRSAAFYGSNASGKSNMLKAFAFVRNFILIAKGEKQIVALEPFRLDQAMEVKPSLFEIIIIVEGTKYRYGFALTKNTIVKEWLYVSEKRKEELLFERNGNSFNIEKKFRGEAEGTVVMLSRITKDNLLFLSTLSQFKSDIVNKIIEWFEKSFVIFDCNNPKLIDYTGALLKEIYYKSRIIKIIDRSDLSFSSIEAEIREKAERYGLEEGVVGALYAKETSVAYRIKTFHQRKLVEKRVSNIMFDLEENESTGSRKFVALLGPILKSMRQSSIIWIDELDASLHTNLLLFIIRLFNSNLNNGKGSQLIYTSHNTNLLKKDLRRDQMIFFRRDSERGSLVTSLHEYDSKVRSDASFDKDYLEGKYTRVPKIDLSPDLFD